jgi:hypothetical protein
MNAPPSEFESLLAVLLEGGASPEAGERLAAFLRADPALRAEYGQQMRVDSLLAFATGQATGRAAAPAPAGKIVRFPVLGRAAAAAVLLLAGALFWSSGPAPRNGPAPVHSRRLARELPPLLDSRPGSFFADVSLPDSKAAATDFLLPAYLNIHIP